MKLMQKFSLLILGLLGATQARAYLYGCELVAQMAGPAYEIRNQRVASLLIPEQLPSEFQLTLLEQNGGWFIYQADTEWFSKTTCAPIIKQDLSQKVYEFSPVLFNRQTGMNAVINGSFLIKTYKEADIDKIAEQYGFVKVTQLPNRFTAIFDVKPQTSYDELLQRLDRDKNIQVAAPLLSEPRYRLR